MKKVLAIGTLFFLMVTAIFSASAINTRRDQTLSTLRTMMATANVEFVGAVTRVDGTQSTVLLEGTVTFSEGPSLLQSGTYTAEMTLPYQSSSSGQRRLTGSGTLRFRYIVDQARQVTMVATLHQAIVDGNAFVPGSSITVRAPADDISIPSIGIGMDDFEETMMASLDNAIGSITFDPGDILTQIGRSEGTSTAQAGPVDPTSAPATALPPSS